MAEALFVGELAVMGVLVVALAWAGREVLRTRTRLAVAELQVEQRTAERDQLRVRLDSAVACLNLRSLAPVEPIRRVAVWDPDPRAEG